MNTVTRVLACWLGLSGLVGCAALAPSPPVDGLAPMTGAAAELEARMPPEPARVATRPEPTPTQRDDLWDRLIQGLALDLDHPDPRIQAQQDWYLQHPAYLTRLLERGQRYLYHFVSQVESRSMPLELALLPVVESAFDPFAYSRSHAAGPWQFIPSTGEMFGLRQDWWQDQRRDLLASTDAALDYLNQLSRHFDGDWLLALASYNAGAGNVGRAIRRNQALRQDTDYWSLQLPAETMSYVPRLIALARIVRDAEALQVTLPSIPDRPYFAVVDTGGQLDLSQAARLAGLDDAELRALNPAWNRWATAPEGPHRLLVPYQARARLEQGLARLAPSERLRLQRHRIQRGDTLEGLARRYQVPQAALRRLNRLSGTTIVAGRDLLIPIPATALAPRPATPAVRQHRVQRGDTLWSIARQHGVALTQLAAWNHLRTSDTLRVGQTLALQAPGVSRPADTPVRQVRYSVRRGDSLHAIASRFNVSVGDISQWNRIDGALLHPGQQLTLYVDAGNAP